MTASSVLSRIDWTAIFTIVLTFVTGYYAVVTHHILRAAARQAAAAEQTAALLVAERQERLQKLRAPVEHVIESGLQAANRLVLALDAQDHPGSETFDLESGNLKALVEMMKAQYFPLAQALRRVDDQIVRARAALDADTFAADEGSSQERRAAQTELRDLLTRWQDAERVLATWQ